MPSQSLYEIALAYAEQAYATGVAGSEQTLVAARANAQPTATGTRAAAIAALGATGNYDATLPTVSRSVDLGSTCVARRPDANDMGVTSSASSVTSYSGYYGLGWGWGGFNWGLGSSYGDGPGGYGLMGGLYWQDWTYSCVPPTPEVHLFSGPNRNRWERNHQVEGDLL